MNTDKIRKDFPLLEKNIVYLDSACMSLKPRPVVEAMNDYYYNYPSCGERSAHRLGKKVTEEYETARKKVARFVGAKQEEIIFTRNTTESVNLVANSLKLKPTDTIITSDKEHNSNFLPWLKYHHVIVPTCNGRFDMAAFRNTVNKNVKVVSVVHTSNIDGETFSVKEIGETAHDQGAVFMIDGAQSVPHKETDVKKIGCDVMAFSGHKMLGPSIGCLYIKKEIAEDMEPFMVGGGTVQDVVNGKPIFLKPPEVFEAGLQNYAGAIGLGAAIGYLESIGMKNVEKHETSINKIITEGLSSIKNVTIIAGSPEERGCIVSFNVSGIDSKELAIMLDSYNIMVRGGFHCCHNWFNTHGISGSVRASLYLYNNEVDAEKFVAAVKKVATLGK